MTEIVVEYRVEWLSQSGHWHPWGSAVRTDRAKTEAACARVRRTQAYRDWQFRVAERTAIRTDWTPTRGDIPPPPPKPPAGRPSTSASETKEGQRRPPPPAPPAGGPSTNAGGRYW